ncbi:hypothetical protein NEAUS04_1961 [Nematocida ausubeli]|uniref:Uncharacterized protein n=1 Tax=Nematocida ausubeli (strain ATCC PRA-371 / ERTm2) TaxID=1913371 RepID=A0A086J2H8_NEMA1|nr:uncharacterized protein NESG_01467 [Nematocida ausubeli]KAI5150280.1 hypothetical protein NEAUS05_2111 [Nematocida ausubeli]KAI5164123.1 hypothetical protein NEAUS04_1961 [Nematocida ausubeli]KFG26346.1 hypothetical protein NESG_01467 [Nematocida ausubeli]
MAEIIKRSYSKIIKSNSDRLIENSQMEGDQSDTDYLIIDDQSDINQEYNPNTSMTDSFFLCMLMCHFALTILFSLYAGFMFGKTDFFCKYNIYPRAFLFLAYGWLSTMSYLILTHTAYHITNIYRTHNNEDKRSSLKFLISSFTSLLIITLVFGMLGGWYSMHSRSNPGRVDLCILFTVAFLFYACIFLTVGEELRNLIDITQLKNTQEEYKNNILYTKCILALIIIAGLALICGCSAFLYELSIYGPEILCSN